MKGALENLNKSFGCGVLGMVLPHNLRQCGRCCCHSYCFSNAYSSFSANKLLPDSRSAHWATSWAGVRLHGVQIKQKFIFAWYLLKNSTVIAWFLTLWKNSLENRAMTMTRNTAKMSTGWRILTMPLSCFQLDQVQIASSAVTQISPWLLIHFQSAIHPFCCNIFGIVAEPGGIVWNIPWY